MYAVSLILLLFGPAHGEVDMDGCDPPRGFSRPATDADPLYARFNGRSPVDDAARECNWDLRGSAFVDFTDPEELARIALSEDAHY